MSNCWGARLAKAVGTRDVSLHDWLCGGSLTIRLSIFQFPCESGTIRSYSHRENIERADSVQPLICSHKAGASLDCCHGPIKVHGSSEGSSRPLSEHGRKVSGASGYAAWGSRSSSHRPQPAVTPKRAMEVWLISARSASFTSVAECSCVSNIAAPAKHTAGKT